MTTLLKSLGISSLEEAAELEEDLGFRFNDLTPQQRETWKRQTVYLGLYAQTRSFTRAASTAGITVRTVRKWQTKDTLGFNDRLELAVLEYTEEIDLIFLQHARKPDCSPSLLMMFARAQIPEKYGPARRDSAPRDSRSDHDDDPKPETSQEDRDSLDDIRRDLKHLKHFAGITHPDSLPGPKPAHDPSTHTAPSTETPSPVLGEGGGEGVTTPSPSTEESLPRTRYGAEGEDDPTPSPVLGEGWGEGDQPTTQDLDPNPSPIGDDSSHLGLSQVGAGFKPAHDPSAHSTPSTETPSPVLGEGWGEGDLPQNPTPALTRRQRRQLQRKQRKNAPYPDTEAKQPNSHRPRAPN